jgi:UTP--glucose-1-phosphate uridylyltransferase
MEIKKVIIPVAGMGTRFLPLSKVVPKEYMPLVDKPVIQYIVEEVKKAGIKEIVFVVSPNQKSVLDYFKKAPELEKMLAKRKKEFLLKEMKEFNEMFEGISFSFAVQKNPLGDGHAILQAASKVKNEAVATSFGDDVFDTDQPTFQQLEEVFKTCGTPVLGLKELPTDKVNAYGVVAVEKIANKLYKIKKIVEKPKPGEAPSNLVITGRHILTPEVFKYLKDAQPSEKGEIILAEVLGKMLDDGKIIYGYEIKGEWLECGDKLKWIKSFFYLALKDQRFKEELKAYLKTIK